MPGMKTLCRFCLALALALTLGACLSPGAVLSPPTVTPAGFLTPYWTATPTASPAPTPTPTRVILPTPTITPTPTPILHVIAKDDTLGALAVQYGVSLEALKTANPGLDPRMMIVGQTLIIPITPTPGGTAAAGAPDVPEQGIQTPQIRPQVGLPRCYLSADGAWCLALVHNDQPGPLENLAAQIALSDSAGNMLASTLAILPLNLLVPGASLPLVAHFPPPLPDGLNARVDLLSVSLVPADDRRYLPAAAQVTEIEIASDGLWAAARGLLRLPQNSPAPGVLWVVVVAYDVNGEGIGVRKWEAPQSCSNWPTPAPLSETATPWPQGTPSPTPSPWPTASALADCLPFDVTVYSLGPAIEQVEVWVEAR
jgi:LysM repeat protein